MDPSMQEGLSQLFEELNEQREKISGAVEEMNTVQETATAKSKMIKVTVDGRGRLTELALRGDRWRDLSPNELSTAIVDAVSRAQEKAQASTLALASKAVPADVDLAEMMAAKPDVDAIFPDFEKMWRSFND